ncbi:unnamed protein product [Mytilus coruscus]|uniref:Reverse transcriptase RNase H-like domain-containing protein n=1 Tax=Mytilus coruscus TaxID=42192 RepID=A0A6J8DBK4_MYTCO|nr:unnamed protein product [Mytilus coruscus]
MGKNNRRQMDFKNSKRRSQIGISDRTSLDRYEADTSQCTESSYYFIRGEWTETQQSLHINFLELEAVHRTVQHFLPQLQEQNVLIKSDNTTVVQYVNKQGGTRSIDLCYKTWDLWQMAIKNKIVLKAAHIAGRKNILAGQLSRNKIFATEWKLNDQVFQTFFFNMRDSNDRLVCIGRQSQSSSVWIPHYKALAVDALTISWDNMCAYAFPICLIPNVLIHMSQYKCRIILIVPLWPRRHWYTQLLQKSIAKPIHIPILKNLLHQPKAQTYHPNPEVFKLTAWLLSTEISEIKAFHETLESHSDHPGDQRTEKVRKDEGKLFLSLVKPFKPVSSQTIARWIVNTIKIAYGEDDFKVNSHSTI